MPRLFLLKNFTACFFLSSLQACFIFDSSSSPPPSASRRINSSERTDNAPDVYVDLNYQNLTMVPRDAFMEPRVSVLNMTNNQIVMPNADFSSLPRLRKLNLAYNKVRSIENITGVSGVEYLFLNSNDLQALRGLEKFNHLRILHAAYNKILTFADIPLVSTLEELNLGHNESLADLENLRNYPVLKKINLEYTAVSSLQGLERFSELEELNVEHTAVKYMSNATYQHLKNKNVRMGSHTIDTFINAYGVQIR